jgi:hypothetical protein
VRSGGALGRFELDSAGGILPSRQQVAAFQPDPLFSWQDDRASLSTIFPERCASRLQSRRRNDRKPNNRKPNDGKNFGVMPRSLPGLQTGDRHGNHLFSLFCLALEGVIRRRNQLLQFHGMASLTPSTGGFSEPLKSRLWRRREPQRPYGTFCRRFPPPRTEESPNVILVSPMSGVGAASRKSI